mmetsp:Transcript_9623/g.28937  ORF Transcript_9623/g.28937 Transcript_9623/m.28937 type:complete len:273 (-) Transcript_9623:724-1542(-)
MPSRRCSATRKRRCRTARSRSVARPRPSPRSHSCNTDSPPCSSLSTSCRLPPRMASSSWPGGSRVSPLPCVYQGSRSCGELAQRTAAAFRACASRASSGGAGGSFAGLRGVRAGMRSSVFPSGAGSGSLHCAAHSLTWSLASSTSQAPNSTSTSTQRPCPRVAATNSAERPRSSLCIGMEPWRRSSRSSSERPSRAAQATACLDARARGPPYCPSESSCDAKLKRFWRMARSSKVPLAPVLPRSHCVRRCSPPCRSCSTSFLVPWRIACSRA